MGRGGVPGEVVKPGGGEIVLVGLGQRRDVVLMVGQACVHTQVPAREREKDNLFVIVVLYKSNTSHKTDGF